MLLAGCMDKTNIDPVCDFDGKTHSMTPWTDVGTGTNLNGDPSVKQIRHCSKCGRVQVAWHR